MPTTSPWNIPYPDGPTVLTALQSHFANIANATNEALTTGLGGAPRLAASDAERDAHYPAPVQGNGVYRTDKGYEERYYALYNVSTNPGGASSAGWHPVKTNDSRWITVSPKATFAHIAGDPFQVRKKGGVFYLQGGFTSAGMSASSVHVVATLPAGYRPAKMVNSMALGGSSAATLARTSITAGGDVTVITGTLAGYYAFDGMTFLED